MELSNNLIRNSDGLFLISVNHWIVLSSQIVINLVKSSVEDCNFSAKLENASESIFTNAENNSDSSTFCSNSWSLFHSICKAVTKGTMSSISDLLLIKTASVSSLLYLQILLRALAVTIGQDSIVS